MPLEKDFLKKSLEFLRGKPVFTSFPLSLLLIGLEKLVEVEFFLCPCIFELNAGLTASIFIGPALFTSTLIFLLLRPFKHKCSGCCAQQNPSDAEQNSSDAHQNCPKAFLSCLIPPVIWIFILLIDGQYVACAMTHWKGVYVLDEELKRSWCKPTEKILYETELRDLTRKYIYKSQYAGYILISVFSALVIVFVGIYDCCISKKCEWCPRQLSSCWRQTAGTQSVRQPSGGADSQERVPLDETRSSTAPN